MADAQRADPQKLLGRAREQVTKKSLGKAIYDIGQTY